MAADRVELRVSGSYTSGASSMHSDSNLWQGMRQEERQLKTAVECHADAYGRTASVSDDEALVTRGTAAVKLNKTTPIPTMSSLVLSRNSRAAKEEVVDGANCVCRCTKPSPVGIQEVIYT